MADSRLVKGLGRPTVWVGGISIVALVAMIVPTLRVGRPIADDYCGYITLANSNFIAFAWDNYINWMANLIGYGLYGLLIQIMAFLPFSWAYAPYLVVTLVLYFALGIVVSLYLYAHADNSADTRTSQLSVLVLGTGLAILFILGLSVTSPTGSLGAMVTSFFVVSYGINHVWAVVAALILVLLCAIRPTMTVNRLKFSVLFIAAFAIGLLGVIESLIFIVVGSLFGLVCLFILGLRNWRVWSKTKPAALFVGSVLAGSVWVISPGVWRRRASIEQEKVSELTDFPIYAVSFVQDSLARALANSSLLLIALMAILLGYLFRGLAHRVRRLALTSFVVVISFPLVALMVALGEFVGYPAWYHEIILNVIAVVLAILLGLLVGASLPRPSNPVSDKGKRSSALVRLVNPMAIAVFGVLTLIGVAAFLSRVEYLQDRADRWDEGYFTTILNPLDGTLVLPDGDSGLAWVAQCARDFAELRNLEFRNYNPPVS